MTALSMPNEHMNDPSNFQRVITQLLFSPERLPHAWTTGNLTRPQVVRYSIVFLVLTSLLFSLATVAGYVGPVPLTTQQMWLRLGLFFAVSCAIFIPLMTLAWSILQAFCSWFLDIPASFPKSLVLSSLGIFYYGVLFLLSIPLFWMKPLWPVGVEFILFALMIGAFLSVVRLFKSAYILAGASPKKAWFTALSPLLLVGLMIGSTMLLTYLALSSGHS